MTIDEAIKKEKEQSIRIYEHLDIFDVSDVEYHKQLSEWLEDYKRLKSVPKHNYDNCHNITCRRKCEKDGYKKAIDDFVNACKVDILCRTFGLHQNSIERIAEQLKAGEEE